MVTITFLGHFFLNSFEECSVWKPAGPFVSHLNIAFDSESTFRIPLKLDFRVPISEAVVRRCSVKKVFLKVSQNSQENSFARGSFLIELKPLRSATGGFL